jgi:primosomal protein N'
VSEPYAATVGALATLMQAHSGGPAGDPAKVATVVLQVAAMETPPLRLLLGSDAVAYAEAAARQRESDDAAWRELSVSTDRTDLTPAAADPLGLSG